ncbi:hypothetical protein [Vibrio parahaemolyticus]|uniref:hypothetical protein n=1 Tax=Vibrio parahaemolyticus TaxID=670 RepID=UPI001869BFD9|nr:hypothetical protein [Vibrio parahaemolyticus]MBE3933100.1 hypothetical protein [Vibrio parahaemolyticus]MBE4044150.1 hypothetical protein [Vibrio parahaemolyticus]MCG6439982.1 hypothetical protein [Vibrio parahaemolyticus]MCG6454417.1 hypothetical protein [Vibrio parahaemolyticus]HCH1968183.1 hypothetical protein [Vibrio parahaemolyticus]
MSKRETSRGQTVVDVVKSDSVVSLGKEYLEIGIDAALDSGALKDIPLVNTVVGLCSSYGTIKDHIFATKLIKFLNQLSDVPLYERMRMVEKLNEDDKFAGKAGTALIEILDRMESEIKPELAAKCFSAYAIEKITYSQLRHMLHAIERVPVFEINGLSKFSVATIGTFQEFDESTLLAYVNAGLGVNNGGFDGGAILPTDLCRLFVTSGVISSN